jgi:hypothetical protein
MKSLQTKVIKTRKSGQSQGTKSKTKKYKPSSWLKFITETLLFLIWLVSTGFAGYFLGKSPIILNDCPSQPSEQDIHVNKLSCIHDSEGSGLALGAVEKTDGFSYPEISRMWKCSQAQYNFTQANQHIYPKNGDLDKTKWKSILSVEPKAFFDKYLTQYPADVRAVQPVVVFSHKPLEDFSQITDVCKVLDIALVPDAPGVCVAVTETYHDVASYHMLHASKQPDGSFALTSNHIPEQIIPEEKHYSIARALLLEYFTHVDYVTQAVKACPKFSKGKVSVGVLLETMEELMLFRNSLASAEKQRISYGKFCLFTTSKDVFDHASDIKSLTRVPLFDIADVGIKDNTLDLIIRTHFLQSWLAFAVANNNNKMLWQSPGTIWL